MLTPGCVYDIVYLSYQYVTEVVMKLKTAIKNLRSEYFIEEFKKYLALLNGKRDMMYGNTFYTHFCYSNPEGRKLLADFVI